MANVLVTGANGFVGRHLCSYLQSRGHVVRGAVRVSTDAPVGYERVPVGDLGSAPRWSAALHDIDTVIHLAGLVHRNKPDPAACFRINVDASLELARQAIDKGASQLIFMSSIAVNGQMTVDKAFDERDQPAPVGVYAQSKWLAEQKLSELAAESNLSLTVIRPPMVYGPDAPGNFAALVRWVSSGVPLPFGGIVNKRSFIGIENLCSVLAACIREPGLGSRRFCVADGEDVSTVDFVHLIARALSRSARLIDVPVPILRTLAALTGQRRRATSLCDSLQIDSSLARNSLRWQPEITLADGVYKALLG